MTLTVYSAPQCGFCKKLKEYLVSKDVDFTEVDLSVDPDKAQYIVKLTGQAGVPVLVKEEEGQELAFVVGYNEERVNELVGIAA